MVLQNVIEVVNEWLFSVDTQAIKVLLATVIANRLQGDPLWIFFIAPPSSAKTELIRALNGIQQIYSLSDLTPQTFISGKVGDDSCSLLLQLNNKILTFKDFTTVLTMHRDKRGPILSQLREIYDGHYKKAFGTGKVISWEGKIGFISGVTPIIDSHYSIFTVLGERFIQYRMEQPDAIGMAKQAIKITGSENKMRYELRQAFSSFFENIELPKIQDIQISEEIRDKLVHLAAFSVRARSGVIRDNYSREIIYTPEPEAPPRLTKQLLTLAYGLAVVDRRNYVSMGDYKIIYRIGFDILHKIRRDIMRIFLKHQYQMLETSYIAEKIGYLPKTVRRYLEDLHSLKILRKLPGGKGNMDKWELSGSIVDLLGKALPSP